MRRSRSQQVPFILGLLALGWGVACLACVGTRVLSEGPSLKLSTLAQPDVVLMSCDQDLSSAHLAAPYSVPGTATQDPSPEPLWCENPDSPHCLPGDPAPTRHEQWLSPLAGTLPALTATSSVRVWRVRSAWAQPRAAGLHSYARHARLERPPRSV
jgi:hypothetical protein